MHCMLNVFGVFAKKFAMRICPKFKAFCTDLTFCCGVLKYEWMAVLFPRDQKLAKSQFSTLVLHTRQLKEDNDKTKT